jgi:uncharacterized protein (TIGR03905 family)
MAFQYRTKGVCSRNISFDIVDGKITGVHFDGGCSGNTKGIAALVEGMPVEDAIRRMEGIQCGFKGTSCPDQLAKAIRQALSDIQ